MQIHFPIALIHVCIPTETANMEINQVLRWKRKFIHSRNYMCVYICIWEKDRGFFYPPQKIPTLEREELALSCMEPGSPLCPAHAPCCRTGFEEGVHIKEIDRYEENIWSFVTKNKGLDHPARPWAPTGTRAFRAFLVLQEVTAQNFLEHLQPTNTETLPPEQSSRVIHEVSVRFLCTNKIHGVFRMDFED